MVRLIEGQKYKIEDAVYQIIALAQLTNWVTAKEMGTGSLLTIDRSLFKDAKRHFDVGDVVSWGGMKYTIKHFDESKVVIVSEYDGSTTTIEMQPQQFFDKLPMTMFG